ncbi:hypothetical protein BT69DRAFT_1278217 [Atractiella rhizophila]|nr:hypothetical protein BT69DRAFT_1278217 [Atractiella rhizophila]
MSSTASHETRKGGGSTIHMSGLLSTNFDGVHSRKLKGCQRGWEERKARGTDGRGVLISCIVYRLCMWTDDKRPEGKQEKKEALLQITEAEEEEAGGTCLEEHELYL